MTRPSARRCNTSRSPVARALVSRGAAAAANDDAAPATIAAGSDDAILHAALRHFAAHGLGAAGAARAEAERALAAGNTPAYARWLEICRMLDRRMANGLARRAGKPRG